MTSHLDLRVTSFDLDQGAIKPHRFFEWAQVGHEALSPALRTGPGIAWVYGRHRARWHAPDAACRGVRVRTWLAEVSGAFATREFTVHDADDGRLLFERQTVSVALDAATLKPTQADLSSLGALVGGPKGSFEPPPFDSDAAAPRFRYERSVEADDLDRQAHVNNVSYLRWATDALARHAWETPPGALAAHRLAELEIRYQHPLRMRDDFVVVGRSADGAPAAWRIEIGRPDGRAVATLGLRVHGVARRSD